MECKTKKQIEKALNVSMCSEEVKGRFLKEVVKLLTLLDPELSYDCSLYCGCINQLIYKTFTKSL